MPSGDRPVRVGVFGVGRGRSFASQAAAMEGVEFVAMCDQREDSLRQFTAQHGGVATYTDYDKFLEHDMDAVVLANYATEHAPAAVKALKAGKHVQSESIAIKTMAEGVQLVRAVEESGLIYMYAENYPYSNVVQEMRYLYERGEIGEFRYGEGEYVHPVSREEKVSLAPTWDHWRNWIPATYYCTHSMGPIMYVTRTRPVRVNGFIVPHDYDNPAMSQTASRNDTAGIIMCQMDNGAYAKVMMGALKCHYTWCRIYGNRGEVEGLRHGGGNLIRLHKEPWDRKPGEPADLIYAPEFREFHDEAVRSGHGGGDFFMLLEFVRAIRSGRPPYLDVYAGLQMSCIGILAHRSALKGSEPIDVPSWRDAAERDRWAEDHYCCDPATPACWRLPTSVLGEIHKPPEVREQFERLARKLRPDYYE